MSGFRATFGSKPRRFWASARGDGEFDINTSDGDGGFIVASCVPSIVMAMLLVSFLNEGAENAGCLLDGEEVSK